MKGNLSQLDANAAEEAKADKVKAAAEEEKKQAAKNRVDELTSFLISLASAPSKQAAMDSSTSFVASYLNVPGAHIAVRKVNGETETLNFMSSNQSFVVGKKIKKITEEGDEVPPRQGVSFEAFKLPVVEEPKGEPDENAPPKPAPVPQPLIIDNVMRDKRIQFFGIPKLGSYLAVPFSFNSCDHAAGVSEAPAPVPNEDGTVPPAGPPFVMNKIATPFIIAVDSIGAFRRFNVFILFILFALAVMD